MLFQVACFNLPRDHLAKTGLQPALDGVLRTLTEMPAHRYPEKSANQAGKDVLQSMLNAHLRHALLEQGWDCEVAAFTTRHGTPSRDRCDMGTLVAARRVLMEVEFGNGASNERNFSKFMCAYRTGELDLAVYIVPTSRMAKRIDSGLTVYETVCRDLEGYPEGHVSCPLIVIGLDIDEQNTADWSKSGVGDPSRLTAGNGNGAHAELFHFIEQYRRGVPLQDIAVPREPSVLKRAKAVSRQLHGTRGKKASAGAGMHEAPQLVLL